MDAQGGKDIDGRLISLVEAAERGENCPDVCVLVGSWVVQGLPIGTKQFLEITYADYWREVSSINEVRRIKNPNERNHFVGQHLAPFMATFGPESPQDKLSLSLTNASVSGTTGPIIQVPALRIPVAAVQTWWSAKFTVDQNKPRGGGVGFGISF